MPAAGCDDILADAGMAHVVGKIWCLHATVCLIAVACLHRGLASWTRAAKEVQKRQNRQPTDVRGHAACRRWSEGRKQADMHSDTRRMGFFRNCWYVASHSLGFLRLITGNNPQPCRLTELIEPMFSRLSYMSFITRMVMLPLWMLPSNSGCLSSGTASCKWYRQA